MALIFERFKQVNLPLSLELTVRDAEPDCDDIPGIEIARLELLAPGQRFQQGPKYFGSNSQTFVEYRHVVSQFKDELEYTREQFESLCVHDNAFDIILTKGQISAKKEERHRKTKATIWKIKLHAKGDYAYKLKLTCNLRSQLGIKGAFAQHVALHPTTPNASKKFSTKRGP